MKMSCIMVVIILFFLEYYKLLIDLLNVCAEMESAEREFVASCQLLALDVYALLQTHRDPPVRVTNYIEATIPSLTSRQFQEHFRMTTETFEILLRHMGPNIKASNKFSPLTKLMDPRRQLLAVLWLIATPDSYRSVGDRFNMAKSSLHMSFVHIVKILNHMSRKVIRWPQNLSCTSSGFLRHSSIPGIIGAIDGSYIAIKAPKEFGHRYINRKCYHAITLQAVCDDNLMFTDVFTGYPSSVSDSRIFVNSDLYKNVLEGGIHIPQNYFIIGDKAYPNLSWCIVPYIDRGTLTSEQVHFNTKLSSARQNIERTFALLKGRFRRLKYLDMTRTDLIPGVILSCCVLHNICKIGDLQNVINSYIIEGLNTVDGEDDSRITNIANEQQAGNPLNLENQVIEGRILRQCLSESLSHE